MANKHNPKTTRTEPGHYQIRVRGHLNGQWADWFDGLTISLEDDGTTLLTGPVTDQARLHNLLRKVRDLGLPLLSVVPVTPNPTDMPDGDQQ